MPQALGYAKPLDVPFFFSSNGDGFLFHDKTGKNGPIETEPGLNAFALMKLPRKTVFKRKSHLCLSPDSTGRGAERNLLWGTGVGIGWAGHVRRGWVGV